MLLIICWIALDMPVTTNPMHAHRTNTGSVENHTISRQSYAAIVPDTTSLDTAIPAVNRPQKQLPLRTAILMI